MDIVQIHQFAEIELAPRQLDLSKDRVGIDVGESAHLSILLRPLKCPGDVDQEIGGLDDLASFGIGQPKPLRLPGETVGPLLG